VIDCTQPVTARVLYLSHAAPRLGEGERSKWLSDVTESCRAPVSRDRGGAGSQETGSHKMLDEEF